MVSRGILLGCAFPLITVTIAAAGGRSIFATGPGLFGYFDFARIRRGHGERHAHSKKLENHAHAIALYFVHYSFCKIHSTLRVTPAMDADLADHVWEIEELLNLLD